MKVIGKFVQFVLSCLVVAVLVSCASEKTKPTDLGINPALQKVRTAWTANIGKVDSQLDVKAVGNALALASSDGTVVILDAHTGADIWRSHVGAPINAGVGSDGRYVAVVTNQNELVTLDAGHEVWRTRLSSQVFTAPLVAGKRVFVLGADRSLAAFDGASGRRLWQNQRPGDALVLRKSGVLMAVDNTLVVGFSGHLVGINPTNGEVAWDVSIATSRGTNDVERMVDLVSGVSRDGSNVCVRAFQSAVGCVNTLWGSISWKRPASGSAGLHGDDQQVYGVEGDGKLLAWRRRDGELVWESDRLRYRELTTPLVVGDAVVVGDDTGLVHWISRTDGSPLTWIATDDSAIATAPVLAGQTLVVVTGKGGVFGFLPE